MGAKVWTLSLEQLQSESPSLNPHSNQNQAIRILVGGCFDVLHVGHIQFLRAAKALGGSLLLAIEPDEKIMQAKNRRPIHSQLQRAEILAELRLVDEVIVLPYLGDYEAYLALVRYLRPSHLAVTAGDPQLSNKQQQAKAVAAELVIVTDPLTGFSSSHLIKEQDWV